MRWRLTTPISDVRSIWCPRRKRTGSYETFEPTTGLAVNDPVADLSYRHHYCRRDKSCTKHPMPPSCSLDTRQGSCERGSDTCEKQECRCNNFRAFVLRKKAKHKCCQRAHRYANPKVHTDQQHPEPLHVLMVIGRKHNAHVAIAMSANHPDLRDCTL